MVYLYAGLGVAMLAGIMAIFEMGLALTGQSLLPSPTDPYLDSPSAMSADSDLLKGLKGVPPGFKNADICQEVIKEVRKGNPSFSMVESLVKTDVDKACAIGDGSHRVVLMPALPKEEPNEDPPYRLYSCVLGVEEICSFEQNWQLDG